MTKRREQRAADKKKRRAVRKERARRTPHEALRRPLRARAGDGMLDPELYAKIGYDPARAPIAIDWLSLDEAAQLERIEAYHALLPSAQRPPDAQLHATIHATVETQLAEGTPAEAREALARLMADGLDRHTALHVIGSVMIRYMRGGSQAGAETFDQRAYVRELATLDRARWLASVSP